MNEEDKKLAKDLELKKFDADGNEIDFTEEEAQAMMQQLRLILSGLGEVVFSDEAAESLKRKGMSQEEITSMMAKAFKASH